MKTGPVLVATLFALTSLPLLGQQSSPDSQPASPAIQQNSPPGAQPAQSTPDNQSSPATQPEQPPAEQQPSSQAAQPEQPGSQAASPATATAAAVEMRPVQGELVSKLDTQTAKTGDNIVVQTKSAVKTADGTEIPKGSKLVGHVVAVQASTGGTNSQVALQFDQAELTGGQKLPIHSEIQSIEPAGGEAAASEPSGVESGPPTGAASPNGSASGSAQSPGSPGAMPGGAAGASGMSNAAPVAGTVVGRTGNITIKTTSVPGVLLANNSPGQQDPRMAQASGILLGAKKDVKLEGGTEMTLAVATMPGGGTQ